MKAAPIPSPREVVGVIVTYGDREPFLRAVLDAVRQQGVSKVVVVNNGAPWPVKETLTAAYGDWAEVVSMGRNTGSAPGYAAGIQHAVATGAEYLWLLDDDNRPAPGCLTTLLTAYAELADTHPSDRLAVLAYRPEHHPDVAWNARAATRQHTYWGFHCGDLPRKILHRLRPCPQKPLPRWTDCTTAPYGGLLGHRSLFLRIGLPLSALVLYGDDTEYTYRITRHGGRIVLVTDARMDDLEASWNVRRTQRRSALEVYIRQGTDLRVYYSTRNRAYFETQCLPGHKSLMYQINRSVYLTMLAVMAFATGNVRRFSLMRAAERNGRAAKLGFEAKFPL